MALSSNPYERPNLTTAKDRKNRFAQRKSRDGGDGSTAALVNCLDRCASILASGSPRKEKKKLTVARASQIKIDVALRRMMEKKSKVGLLHDPSELCEVLPCAKLGPGQQGLYSRGIASGTTICAYTGEVTVATQQSQLPTGGYVFSLQLDGQWVAIDPEKDKRVWARYANHGDLPNAEFVEKDGVVYIVALSDIAPGMQVIVSYTDQAHKFFGFVPMPVNAGDGALSLQAIAERFADCYEIVPDGETAWLLKPKIFERLSAAGNLALFPLDVAGLDEGDALQVNLPWINCTQDGVLLNSEGQLYLQSFAQACASGNIMLARAMYACVKDPHYIDHTGNNALMLLCQVVKQRPKVAEQDFIVHLVKQSFNLCPQSGLSQNNTPLHICVIHDSLYMAQVILREIKRRGPEQEVNFTNLVNDSNQDVLMLAIELGRVDFVKLFIANLFPQELVEKSYLETIRQVEDLAIQREIFGMFSRVYKTIPHLGHRFKAEILAVRREIMEAEQDARSANLSSTVALY